MRPPAWEWLGRLAYADALDRQRARREAVITGAAPEVIWLLEHPPVVTVGRRPAPGTPDAAELSARGVGFHRVERGGLATWHGPGQLVAYVIIDAWRRSLGPRRMVTLLEQAVIDWLSELGVMAGRRNGLSGVWIGTDKICAIGLHFRRGVSLHGLAINLDPDLSGFGLIVPCGITEGGVTSLARLIGHAPSPAEAAPSVARHICRALRPPRALRTRSTSALLTASAAPDKRFRPRGQARIGPQGT